MILRFIVRGWNMSLLWITPTRKVQRKSDQCL
jgi:hypothetical protein